MPSTIFNVMFNLCKSYIYVCVLCCIKISSGMKSLMKFYLRVWFQVPFFSKLTPKKKFIVVLLSLFKKQYLFAYAGPNVLRRHSPECDKIPRAVESPNIKPTCPLRQRTLLFMINWFQRFALRSSRQSSVARRSPINMAKSYEVWILRILFLESMHSLFFALKCRTVIIQFVN